MPVILRKKSANLRPEKNFRFHNKVIWLFSPEQWSDMRLSKHHYAEALAQRGNRVYFFEPGNTRSAKIELTRRSEHLTVVNYPLKARGWGKLPAFLYSVLIEREINSLRKGGIPAPDLVWCFDPLRAAHLSHFRKALTVYHPVDQFDEAFVTRYQVNPDVAFSTMEKVRDKMLQRGWNALFLHHGLAQDFAIKARERLEAIRSGSYRNAVENTRLKVGFSGNLLGEAAGREEMKSIIESNPDCDFHFWGRVRNEASYIQLGSHHPEFIQFLESRQNVVLHGPVNSTSLAEGLHQMNMLWMIWKKGDHSQWNAYTNPHKVMEYLSTGVPVLTHFMYTYRDTSLLHMSPPGATINDQLQLFNMISREIRENGSEEVERMRLRIEFALDHTYERLLDTAEAFINTTLPEYNG